MTKYDLIVEELQNRVESGELDLEFAEAVNDLAYERYVIESSRDISSELKTILSNYKDSIKEIKKLIKEGNTKEARKEITKAKQELAKAEKEINSIQADISGAILGVMKTFLISLVILTLKDNIVANLQNQAAVASINALNNEHGFDEQLTAKTMIVPSKASSVGVSALITAINTAYKLYKKGDEDSIIDALDGMKKVARDIIKECNKTLDKLEAGITKMD